MSNFCRTGQYKGNRGTEQENNREEEHVENTAKPTSESESISDQELRIAPETKKKLEFLKEFEGSIKERFLSSSNIEELKAVDVFVGPLILIMCKSKPTRTRKNLDLDARKFLNNNSYINKYLRLLIVSFSIVAMMVFKYRCEQDTL